MALVLLPHLFLLLLLTASGRTAAPSAPQEVATYHDLLPWSAGLVFAYTLGQSHCRRRVWEPGKPSEDYPSPFRCFLLQSCILLAPTHEAHAESFCVVSCRFPSHFAYVELPYKAVHDCPMLRLSGGDMLCSIHAECDRSTAELGQDSRIRFPESILRA